MIRLLPIVEHLKAGGYANTEGLMEFLGLTSAPRSLPALFVVPRGERAGANRLSGATDQRVEHQIAVVLILPVKARRQAEVSDALTEHVRKIRDIMLSWQHPDASRRWEYVGGELTDIDAGVVAWSIGFSAPYHLRNL